MTAILTWLSSHGSQDTGLPFLLIGSFGASIAIISALPDSEAARGKNIIIGSLFSAFIGVLVAKNIPGMILLA